MSVTIYSDIKLDAPYKNSLVYNVQSVQQALTTLFSTNKGERLFLPEYGCDLEDILFELMDKGTELMLLQLITSAIARWEPRVKLNQGLTEIVADPDNNSYDITLVYSIIGLEDEQFTFVGTISQ